MSPILGYQHQAALDAAVDLGIAMQLTNILRDVGADLAQGRVYLPEEDLAAFGYSQIELEHTMLNDAFVRLIEFQMARAEELPARHARHCPARSRCASRHCPQRHALSPHPRLYPSQSLRRLHASCARPCFGQAHRRTRHRLGVRSGRISGVGTIWPMRRLSDTPPIFVIAQSHYILYSIV